jgi:O-antigen/teichoic acid export membrane protein
MVLPFLRHVSLLLVLNLAIKPLYLLVVEARIQDALGPEVYGTYFPALGLATLLNILLDWGLTNHLTRDVAANPAGWKRIAGGAFRTKGLLIPLYFSVLIAGGVAIGWRGEALGWLVWAGLNQALLSAVLFLRGGLQGLGNHRADALVSVADRALLLAGLGALLAWSDAFELPYLLAGTTASLILAAGFAAVQLRATPRPAQDPAAVDSTRAALRAGTPYALLVLLMMAYHRLDAILLERMRADGALQAGLYAMGYRLFEAANMVGYLVATVLLPYFTRMLASGEDVRPLAAGAARALAIGGTALAAAAWADPAGILAPFYSASVAEAAPILPPLMLSFAVFAQGYVFSTLLTARGELRLLIGFAAAGAVVGAVLNVLWIPSAGAVGSAWASAAAQTLVVAAQTAAVLRQHPGAVWRGVARGAAIHIALCAALAAVWAAEGPTGTGAVWGLVAIGLVLGVLSNWDAVPLGRNRLPHG